MRRLDEMTIKECGLPGVVLMENAGRGAARLTAEHFGDLGGRRVAVVCGKGNNGGDGLVMARIFHGWQARVRIYLLGRREAVSGDARINLEVAMKMGLDLVEISEEAHLDRLDLSGADLVIDAILGTGLASEVKGLYRDVIEAINRGRARVMSVDVPSGLDSDTGRVWGTAVRADLTVTFGLPKIGLVLDRGEEFSGRLEVLDIGIPPHALAAADPGKELLTEAGLKGLLRPRDRTAHKGHFGHVLLVAGSTGKTGAAALAAQAAARTGAGLVTLAVPAGLNAILENKVTEVMTEPLPEEMSGFVGAEAVDRVLELAVGKSVLALGPGLGTNPGAGELVRNLVERCDLPLVIDADGLNALVGQTEVLRRARREVVLTPHPGEMSRLTGLGTAQLAADRLKAAKEMAQSFGIYLALKGHRTVVAAPDGRLWLNTSGGPHMASGGMGDILTGILAGLISQGIRVEDAARLGVYVHGLAADQAASGLGAVGLMASDLLPLLPGLWSKFIA
jgi:NAD(P)H-hydrate epimerase